MKPFNLEAAKAGDPIVTRDGREAKFIAYVPEVGNYEQIVILIDKVIFSYPIRGNVFDTQKSESDLFMAPKKRVVWVNFFGSAKACFYYASEKQADLGFDSDYRIGGKAYPVEIVE